MTTATSKDQPRILTRGNVEQGLKESDKVIERVYHCPTMWSGGMEPRACVAQWEGDRLTMWASTQSPFRVHASLAAMFNLPDSNVRIIASYIGGGFGTKSAPHTDEALAALLARKARLPVKLQYSREEEILDSNTRFETRMYVRIGVKNDMSLHALDVKAYINQGAYHTRLGGLGNQATHVYKTPHVQDGAVPRPHQHPEHRPDARRRRSAGDVRHRVGDRRDRRRDGLGSDGVPAEEHQAHRRSDRARRRWHRRRPAGHAGAGPMHRGRRRKDRLVAPQSPLPGSQTGSKARGIGIACTERGGGGGLGGASVKVNLDGSAIVFYSSTDIGTGSRTTLAMIAAETLGMPLSMFRAVSGDTEVAPYDGGSQGNRTLQGTGRAVEAAARECLQQILASAGPLLDNAAPGDLEMRDGVIRVKAQPARSRQARRGDAAARPQRRRHRQHDAAADGDRTSSARPRAHFVEVEVDRETGKVRILRYIAAHDVGRPINVTIVENQIEGGTHPGAGAHAGRRNALRRRAPAAASTPASSISSRRRCSISIRA